MRVVFVNHQTLVNLANRNLFTQNDDDPNLAKLKELVRDSVNSLPESQQLAISMFYFERASVNEIAAETGMKIIQVKLLLRNAKTSLKHALVDFVGSRWPNCHKMPPRCPICCHQKRKNIDAIIFAKPESQNWRKLNHELLEKLGVTFNPPMLIKNHLKYHKRS